MIPRTSTRSIVGKGLWGLKARVAAVKEGWRLNASIPRIALMAATSRVPIKHEPTVTHSLEGWIVRIFPYYQRKDVALGNRIWHKVDPKLIDEVVEIGRTVRDIAYYSADVEHLGNGKGVWCATINNEKAKRLMDSHADSRPIPDLSIIFNNIKGLTLANDEQTAMSMMMSRVMVQLKVFLTDHLDSIIPGPRYIIY